MSPLDGASLVVLVGAAAGLSAAAIFAVARRGRHDGLTPGTAIARAGSYAGLALLILVAARLGVDGVAVAFIVLGAVALLEWSRLYDLPAHHRIALIAVDVLVLAAVAREGAGAADWLVGGLVLVGVVWPVLRSDTARAMRDLGLAAVGAMIVVAFLAHGVALVRERGEVGAALLLALAVGCAGADVAAFVVGRTFGRHPLAPRLSPGKTREGALGGLLGAAIGIGPFAPALVPVFGAPFVAILVPVVAGGSLWGDLLESAAKREAGVKDAGSWLPGFGGILDRIDSLLVTMALAYWIARLWGAGVGVMS